MFLFLETNFQFMTVKVLFMVLQAEFDQTVICLILWKKTDFFMISKSWTFIHSFVNRIVKNCFVQKFYTAREYGYSRWKPNQLALFSS